MSKVLLNVIKGLYRAHKNCFSPHTIEMQTCGMQPYFRIRNNFLSESGQMSPVGRVAAKQLSKYLATESLGISSVTGFVLGLKEADPAYSTDFYDLEPINPFALHMI